MTTKLYLTAASSGLTLPTADAAVWDGGNTGGSNNSLLSPSKSGSNASVTANETTTTNNWDLILRRFVSAPFVRQRLLSPGSLETASLTISQQENNASANMFMRTRLTILRANGSTVVAMCNDLSATEWTTTATARTEAMTLTETLAEVGDRLVLEVGVQAQNTSNTSFTATSRYGGTDATDLADGTTSLTSRSPHITLPNSFDVLWTVANSTMPVGGLGGFFG